MTQIFVALKKCMDSGLSSQKEMVSPRVCVGIPTPHSLVVDSSRDEHSTSWMSRRGQVCGRQNNHSTTLPFQFIQTSEEEMFFE